MLKCLLLTTCIMAIPLTANSALFDRGSGLIYDDALDVTWLQDANYAYTSGYDTDGLMTWEQSVAWAGQLNYGGFMDWRLPAVAPINGVAFNLSADDYSGTDDGGWNVGAPGTAYAGSTESEFAHLFYTTLGNISSYNLDGSLSSCYPSSCLINTEPFVNLQSYIYWNETVSDYDPIAAWVFVFDNGRQDETNNYNEYYAWAVHDGDIGASVVPVPAAVWLFGSGLLGLIGFARGKKA